MDCTKYVLLFLKEHTVTCNALLVDHGRCYIMSSRLERSSAQLRTMYLINPCEFQYSSFLFSLDSQSMYCLNVIGLKCDVIVV